MPRSCLKVGKVFNGNNTHWAIEIPEIFPQTFEGKHSSYFYSRSRKISIKTNCNKFYNTRYKYSDFSAIIKCVIKCSWDVWDMIFSPFFPPCRSEKAKHILLFMFTHDVCSRFASASISCSLNII